MVATSPPPSRQRCIRRFRGTHQGFHNKGCTVSLNRYRWRGVGFAVLDAHSRSGKQRGRSAKSRRSSKSQRMFSEEVPIPLHHAREWSSCQSCDTVAWSCPTYRKISTLPAISPMRYLIRTGRSCCYPERWPATIASSGLTQHRASFCERPALEPNPAVLYCAEPVPIRAPSSSTTRCRATTPI